MLTALSALTAAYLKWAINNRSLLSLFFLLFILTPALSLHHSLYLLCPFAGRHISMGEVHWFSNPYATPPPLTPALLSSPKRWPPSHQSTWLPQADCWVWLRWGLGVTRRLRGDMRLCPQWCAPCAASLGSSTAFSVSDDVVKALLACLEMVFTKRFPYIKWNHWKIWFHKKLETVF